MPKQKSNNNRLTKRKPLFGTKTKTILKMSAKSQISNDLKKFKHLSKCRDFPRPQTQ